MIPLDQNFPKNCTLVWLNKLKRIGAHTQNCGLSIDFQLLMFESQQNCIDHQPGENFNSKKF